MRDLDIVFLLLALAALFLLLQRLITRLQLSLAKHRSLGGHSRMSRRLARLLPFFAYDRDQFLASDGAPDDVRQRRASGLEQLAHRLQSTSPQTLAKYEGLDGSLADVGFTTANRVPFPYREALPAVFKAGTVVQSTGNVTVTDSDGIERFDLGGSYGLNVFGYDFYKSCMDEGLKKTRAMGPVLGPYHPLVTDNVQRLQAISGLDEVSFHMSGTEAVMQAVRLARYHTGRKYLVRMCGAYHGWWDGVQPGVGNYRDSRDIFTLSEMSEATLKVLRTRRDIACVLISPGQALNPNRDARSDASLLSSPKPPVFDREAYTEWLGELREVCTERGIVLILDEVFTGFRLGVGGAQEYFGVQADLVTYGKTVGGGLPIGVVCGRHELMQRFKPDAPADLFIARGTFNSHPMVMGCMNAFLHRIAQGEYRARYQAADALWNARTSELNQMLAARELPVTIVNMQAVLTVNYLKPSRYNWMFQFYLRDAGLELSWVGTGRLIMSLAYTDAEWEAVAERFVAAATRMAADGWWWQGEHLTNAWIGRQYARDLLGALMSRLIPGLQPYFEPTSVKEPVNE